MYKLFNCLLQLDGRVKTLHPSIHGGILARRDQSQHMEALNKHSIGELRPDNSPQHTIVSPYVDGLRS